MVYSLIFFTLAAICNAVMDKLSFHFYDSVFSRDVRYWQWFNPEVSWRNKYIDKMPSKGLRKWLIFDVQFTDAWHTFKSLMIVFLALSIITFDLYTFNVWWIKLIVFCVYGFVWNVVFNLFYNRLLKK